MRVILNRLWSGNYYNLVSRFAISRRTYSACVAASQACFKERSSEPIEARSSIFQEQDPTHFLSTFRRDGFVRGLALPSDLVDEIHRYATVTPCHSLLFDGSFFRHEVSGGTLPSGQTVMNASVDGLDQCEAVGLVARDPFLLRVATGYLGYRPRRVRPELRWSFRSDVPAHDQWKRAHMLQAGGMSSRASPSRWQRLERRMEYYLTEDPPLSAVYYHFDTFGYNSIRAYFYMTDAERSSGVHVVIRGSHSRKSARMLMSPGVFPESRLLSYYGQENEVYMEGPAGTGFFEDVACYHKLLPPTDADRLMLIVTYS